MEALEKADYLSSTSKFLAGEISSLDPKHREPELLPYGVDTSIFDPDKVTPTEFPWPEGAPKGLGTITIGFFKALEMTYGPDLLITAIAAAKEKVPGIRCVLGGSGKLLSELKKWAENLQIADRVYFPGRIAYGDMPRALAAIDIFVMPSRMEALGVAALEASAMRKPVIATGKWGIPEAVKAGTTGSLVRMEDLEDLTREIVRLSLNSELRELMGERGRAFVKENYQHEKIMEIADQYCRSLTEPRE